MKRSTLFIAVLAAMSLPSQAMELVDDGVNKVTLGGHLSVQLSNYDWYQGIDDSTELNANSPRVNLALTRDMGEGFTVEGKIESGFNMDEGGNSWTTRLGYLAVKHDSYGRLSAGKEWSTYYDVAWWTDVTIAFTSDQLGIYSNDTAGDDTGMGRADQVIQYRNNIALGEKGRLSAGVQWQGENGALDSRVGGSLIYQYDQARVGIAYVGGDVIEDYELYGATIIDLSKHQDTLESWQLSAAYGKWSKGLYVAAAYQQGTNTEAGIRFAGDSIGFEAIGSYGFKSNTTAFVSYRQLESDGDVDVSSNYGGDYADDGDGEWNESFVTVGVHQLLSANTMIYTEYNVSTGDDRNGDNQYALGFRLFL
ncbi:porin [Ferrimonas lipolytica]|uniref:Porin n=1 Tax=Ferrimonas lipolytica TaxID=2724191 RepID=A0A6H1UDI8_9GAMM|nr:porin [Ferrimonas lipolytica]QIZ76276.1 porin [Ferrimonas lipolytica]